MKVEKAAPVFQPLVVTVENADELKWLKAAVEYKWRNSVTGGGEDLFLANLEASLLAYIDGLDE